MKTITLYECEICHRRYEDKAEAKNCESQGAPDVLPVGLIFGNAKNPDHHSKNLTFCVGSNENAVEGHWYHPALWACRDNGRGDSLGKELCGGMGGICLYSGNAACKTHPTFKRMVKFLKSEGIKPLMWNGKKIVPV